MNFTRLLTSWVVLLGVIGSASSCEYNNAANLFPPPPVCETENMSFAGDIVPILAVRCNQCHSASEGSGGVVLEGYQEVLQWADNGLLLCSIKWDEGCSEMPKNAPKIPQCEIDKIESWISDGALEN